MGVAYSALLKQSWPSKPTWTPDEIPDLTGKVVLVTGSYAAHVCVRCGTSLNVYVAPLGGNSGVGKEMVRVLLLHNATVYLAARSASAAQSAISELEQSTGRTARFLQLDLADLASVRAAAVELVSREERLDVLFNNAGVFLAPRDKLTAQGYDMTVGTNVLGPFLFTQLLLPLLSNANSKGRVISTSSVTHYFAPRFDFAVARPGPARDKLGRDGVGNDLLYAQTKTAETVLALERAKRYGDALVSIAVNPGNIRTNMQRNMTGFDAVMAVRYSQYLESGPRVPRSDGKCRRASCLRSSWERTLVCVPVRHPRP